MRAPAAGWSPSGHRVDDAGREHRRAGSAARGVEASGLSGAHGQVSVSYQLPVFSFQLGLLVTFSAKLSGKLEAGSWKPHLSLSPISATTYATTAMAADARAMSIGSILSIVSAAV